MGFFIVTMARVMFILSLALSSAISQDRYWGSYSAVYPAGGSGSSADVAFDVANLQEASRQSLTASASRAPAPRAPAPRAPAPQAPAPRAPAPRAPAPRAPARQQQRLNSTHMCSDLMQQNNNLP